MALDGTVHGSYWMESTETTSHPPLTGALEVDVAVIGGGIAGLSTAWELARRGRKVAVLEADRIAAGVTGHTTAKLSALHGLTYSAVRRAHDAGTAALHAQAQSHAVQHVVGVCADLGLAVDLERAPAFVYAESEKGVEKIREEADAAREAGLAASFVTYTTLPFPVAGAVRVDDQMQFHPRKYLLGLARDMLEHGAVIHERTRVVELKEGSPCRLTTEYGAQVTAGDVVVATHYPVFDRAVMFARLKPRRELVVAGAIPAEDDPAGMFITPEHRTRSVRTAPLSNDRRLLLVTGESFTPGDEGVAERFDRLSRWAREHFPRVSLDYRWATQDNDTEDSLPYIGLFHPGARHVWVATGFGGWGMSSGVLAGTLLAAAVTGTDSPPWAKIYDPRRVPRLRAAQKLVKFQASVARHFIGDRVRTPHADSVTEIAPGDGAIVRIDGRRCAVHRDHDGTLQAVSARCTHLGCLVQFNDAETTWDCPCHGSRFGVDGSVIQGPATSPLQARKVAEGGMAADGPGAAGSGAEDGAGPGEDGAGPGGGHDRRE
ncbi:FAD-dependent oxidoreductase [Streptomyces sp. 549]|uniref:FAD-dependent oxidoreductase n=1 Tax=Streptomyces sp. 549 TaxID=3049076 RepID=UPI0024C469A2|nr:FAD-dependent oxidoreductase [Streptomyces sp. 549]MDK1471943.1 FAD-dependent oxidoreductase [Streptomyces sp. 549]